jgi:phenylacetate-CoA ligase
MNIRRTIYFSYMSLRGRSLPLFYKRFLREDTFGVPPDRTRNLLIELISHCQHAVPYYKELICNQDQDFKSNPELYLAKFPILTKNIIRTHFDQLKSTDLALREWWFNTSGGSTGEPVRFIQDRAYDDRSEAITRIYSKWAGHEIGEPEVRLWGSERDIFQESIGLKASLFNRLTNATYLNAFRMDPEKMRGFIGVINSIHPKVIVSYAQAIYELAKFAQQERIPIVRQSAIITSAGTLYSFMRETIETVFQCKVFNRYGSREVGNIACQCSAHQGLHVAPWGHYLEIVDDNGDSVADGLEGNILVTCLTNFAMPLIRYKIGDRGILSNKSKCACGREGQILDKVLGRNVDAFKNRDGTLIDGEYFTHLLYFRDWVWKFQVIQKSYSHVVFNIVQSDLKYEQKEFDEIIAKTKLVMGDDCIVEIQLVDAITPSASGKYRYTISEVQQNESSSR